MNYDYLDKLDNAISGKLRCRDYLGAWEDLDELAEEILDRDNPPARPILEARLLSLLQHLVDNDAYLAINPDLAKTAIIERLRKAATVEEAVGEFRALVREILGPARLWSHQAAERHRLGPYLEKVARERLNDPSAAEDIVAEVFAEVFRKGQVTATWELPRGRRWLLALAWRVRDKAVDHNRREARLSERVVFSEDPEVLAPRPSSAPFDTQAWIDSPQEAAVYVGEKLEQLSTGEFAVYRRKVEGFTDLEISRQLNIPERTLQRTLQYIRTLLSDE